MPIPFYPLSLLAACHIACVHQVASSRLGNSKGLALPFRELLCDAKISGHNGNLERVIVRGAGLQAVADERRKAGVRVFEPGGRMGEFMARVEESWKTAP